MEGCARDGGQEAFLVSVTVQTCFLTLGPVDQLTNVAAAGGSSKAPSRLKAAAVRPLQPAARHWETTMANRGKSAARASVKAELQKWISRR